MSTSQEDIRQWLERAKQNNATHLIVVCDTYDWDDYPVEVTSTENIHECIAKYNGKNMQKIMEVYNLKLDIEKQLNEGRSYNL